MPLPWVAGFCEITDSSVTLPKLIIWPKCVGWEVFNKETSSERQGELEGGAGGRVTANPSTAVAAPGATTQGD